jgi:hypothetical protein
VAVKFAEMNFKKERVIDTPRPESGFIRPVAGGASVLASRIVAVDRLARSLTRPYEITFHQSF